MFTITTATAAGASADPPNAPLNVGTFNAFLKTDLGLPDNWQPQLEGIGTWGTNQPRRANAIAQRIELSNFAVLGLQEVFDEDARLEFLASTAYPYKVAKADDWSNPDDSGLMILSKLPFQPLPDAAKDCVGSDALAVTVRTPDPSGPTYAVGREFFESNGWDSLSAKGFVYVRLFDAASGRYLNVINTHTQASYYSDYASDSQMNIIWSIREAQMNRVAGFINCARSKGVMSASEPTFLIGDLNINGDLSKPSVPIGSSYWASVPQGLRSASRREWDTHFHPTVLGTDTDYDVLHVQIQDQWLKAMTLKNAPNVPPLNCLFDRNTPSAPPFTQSICTVRGPAFPMSGPADLDRGLSLVGDEQRIDYLFLTNPVGQREFIAPTHLMQNGGLFTSTHGDLPGCLPGGPSCGSDPTSDHIGTAGMFAWATTPANDKEGHLAPSDAVLAPPSGKEFRTQAAGQAQWFRFDKSGLFSFLVEPTAITPSASKLSVKVFEARDMTHPLIDWHGGDVHVPAVGPHCALSGMTCDPAGAACPNPQDECLPGSPEYIGAKYNVVKGPFFVKVSDPTGRARGSYRLHWHQLECTTIDDACDRIPFQGKEFTDPVSPGTFPAGKSDLFFNVDADHADGAVTGSLPDDLVLAVAEPAGARKIARVDVYDPSTLAVIATRTAPTDTGSDGRMIYRFVGWDSLGMPYGGSSPRPFQRLGIKVHKVDGVSADFPVAFWWETNLTFVGARSTSTGACLLNLTSGTNDTLSEDEIWLDLLVDDVWDMKRRRVRNAGDPTPTTSMEWIGNFSKSANRMPWADKLLWGDFSSASARHAGPGKGVLRYRKAITGEICEFDSFINGEDDCASDRMLPLGPVMEEDGEVSLNFDTNPGGSGGAYRLDLKRAHYNAFLGCSVTADCPGSASVIECRDGFCQAKE